MPGEVVITYKLKDGFSLHVLEWDHDVEYQKRHSIELRKEGQSEGCCIDNYRFALWARQAAEAIYRVLRLMDYVE